jgi:hypothetical protein
MDGIFKTAIVLTIMAFVFSGCRRDTDSEEPLCHGTGFSKDVKEWMLFQPGTYWIYEEENSGIIDSVYVTFATHYGDPESADFNCITKNTLDNYESAYHRAHNELTCFPCLSPHGACVIIMREKYKPNDFVGETVYFLYDHFIGDWRRTGNDTIALSNIQGSLALENDIFSNVVQIHHAKDITEHDQETNFYFAKNIGIVKKELLDSNQVWNLIRYYIVQ